MLVLINLVALAQTVGLGPVPAAWSLETTKAAPAIFTYAESAGPIVQMTCQPASGQVAFSVAKVPGQPPAVSLVTGQYTNASSAPVTDFVLQAAVPKSMTLAMGGATGSVLPPGNGGAVMQTITVNNSALGAKPLVMRLKISYTHGGAPVAEELTCSGFPPGC